MAATPVIAITTGEPAGIGPDLCVLLPENKTDGHRVYIGDPEVLAARARARGRRFSLPAWDPEHTPAGGASLLAVKAKRPVQPGRPDRANAAYVIQTLSIAAKGCLDGRFQALVTAPVHKGIINDAGIPFTGHTEFFAQQADAPCVVMLLVAGPLRVALATTHLPLARVSETLANTDLEAVIGTLHRGLRTRFRIPEPVIAVCGLNPHAGEDGHLGDEERRFIGPAVERCRRRGLHVRGPVPADTAFTPRALEGVDAVLAMYHDQGLPVLKHAGFGRAVNLSLGLPFVRTSVDHGTALDRAGDGPVDTGSMQAALDLALRLLRP